MEKLLGITNPLSEQLQQSGLGVVSAESLLSATRNNLLNAKDEARTAVVQKAAFLSNAVGLQLDLHAAVDHPARSRSPRV